MVQVMSRFIWNESNMEVEEVEGAYQLYIDNGKINEEDALVEIEAPFDDPLLSVTLINPSVASELLSHTWDDLPEEIVRIILNDFFDWFPLKHSVSLLRGLISSSDPSEGMMDFGFNMFAVPENNDENSIDHFSSYSAAFGRLVAGADKLVKCSVIYGENLPGFSINISINEESDIEAEDLYETITTQTLKRYIDLIESRLQHLHRGVIDVLSASKISRLSLYFDFPQAVKVPCEQYLLYFAQFLKDAGVDATTDLEHDAAGVLFTVTPESGEEALDKIRQALGVYLRLPSNPSIIQTPIFNQPVEVQMMAATIQHLNSQLMFANASRQALETTLQNQSMALNRQMAQTVPITPEVLIESIRAVVAKPDEDKEVLVGGALEITKYKGNGFNLGLPDIFRWAKNLLFEPNEPTKPINELAKYDEQSGID